MEWLHDLHSDDMLVLGSVATVAGLIVGALVRLGYSNLRKRRISS